MLTAVRPDATWLSLATLGAAGILVAELSRGPFSDRVGPYAFLVLIGAGAIAARRIDVRGLGGGWSTALWIAAGAELVLFAIVQIGRVPGVPFIALVFVAMLVTGFIAGAIVSAVAARAASQVVPLELRIVYLGVVVLTTGALGTATGVVAGLSLIPAAPSLLSLGGDVIARLRRP